MSDLLSLSPYIRVASDNEIVSPFHLHERVLFDYELLYVKKGTAIITIEDLSYEAKKGDIFLIKPGQRNSFVINGQENFHQPHLHFDLYYENDSEKIKVSFKNSKDMSKEELEQIRTDNTGVGSKMELPNFITVSNEVYFEKLLFDIINEFEAMTPFYKIQMKSSFLRLWTYLLRETHITQNKDVFLFAKEYQSIKDYISKNYNKTITLDELSEKFHISKYHLLRKYKKIYGISPAEYNRKVRIEKAKELIMFTNMSIEEISLKLGFSSVNAFYRTFVNTEGVQPSFFRSNYSY